jgi:ADP-ribosylglycohydrolase
MTDHAKAMIMASFVADSLALGAHWIYDTGAIERQFGRVDRLIKPLKDSYHPTKDAGEFTHYGDQTLCLLESVSPGAEFDLNRFARKWQALFDGYQGYIDGATRMTRDNFVNGKGPEQSGSSSADLGGAARIAPLVYRFRENPENLVSAARAQTAMTHNHPQVIDAAEFFARVAGYILKGEAPAAAIQLVIEGHFEETPLKKWVDDGINSSETISREAIGSFGRMCDVHAAFPSVIHLITRYADNLEAALIENVMAGGDSAARGLIAGMVLGAHLGWAAVPDKWLAGLKKRDEIYRLLDF